MHGTLRIVALQTARTLHRRRVKIIAGIKGQRVVVPLVGTAAKVALKLFGPASSTPLFKKRGQQGAQQFDRATLQRWLRGCSAPDVVAFCAGIPKDWGVERPSWQSH